MLKVLRSYGFVEGRMISHSKTGYCRRNRDHFVVFNAQIFTPRGRILKQADLDLTLDGGRLTEAARAVGQNFFVLYENDPTHFRKPTDRPISSILREAVWWTKCQPKDEDWFMPLASGPLCKKHVGLRCVTGRWREQLSFSVEFWTNRHLESLRNYSGAALQLVGLPPKTFQTIEEREDLEAEVSPTGGREVRPLFYHHSGLLDYVWFNHGAAIPAILYDHTLRLIERLKFTVHRGNSAIHVRRDEEVVGLCWPVGISAPEVTQNARAELKRLSTQPTQESGIPVSSPKKDEQTS